MKQVKIKIKTENDAFQPDPDVEVARILRLIADRLENNIYLDGVADSNGNVVAKIKIR